MHLPRFRPILLPALAATALLSLGCRNRAQAVAEETVPAVPPSSSTSTSAVPPAPATPPQPATPAEPVTPPAAPTTTVLSAPPATALSPWGAITDYTYDRRADFTALLTRLAGATDTQIDQLNARRATLPETSVKDWDVAMKELTDARSDLQFKVSQLNGSLAENWPQMRDSAADAWRRVQEATDKVKRSTTL